MTQTHIIPKDERRPHGAPRQPVNDGIIHRTLTQRIILAIIMFIVGLPVTFIYMMYGLAINNRAGNRTLEQDAVFAFIISLVAMIMMAVMLIVGI